MKTIHPTSEEMQVSKLLPTEQRVAIHPELLSRLCDARDLLRYWKDEPVEPKYSCGAGIELQQPSEPLVAVDLPALRHSQWRQ